jgi:hypothetical protein
MGATSLPAGMSLPSGAGGTWSGALALNQDQIRNHTVDREPNDRSIYSRKGLASTILGFS